MKQRVHAVLLTHGKPCPVSDLFGVRGRQLLARLGLPEPWQATIEASLRLIDELEREISDCEPLRPQTSAAGSCLRNSACRSRGKERSRPACV